LKRGNRPKTGKKTQKCARGKQGNRAFTISALSMMAGYAKYTAR
jgi:hypothetical protein